MTKEEIEKRIAELELEVAILDNTQHALKILNNSGYGAIAQMTFRYFDVSIAEAITATGQYVIQKTADRLNEYLNDRFGTGDKDYVAGCDTDSAMLTLDQFVILIDPARKVPHAKMVDVINRFCEDELEPFLDTVYDEMSDTLGARKNTLKMKREAIADYQLYRAKKNYVMRVWDMEHVRYAEPKLKIAGIETQRSDKPRICRDALLDLIPVFFDGNEDQLQKKVSTFKKKFMAASLSDIAIPKGVNNLSKYLDTRKWEAKPGARVPGHVMASGTFNKLLKKYPDIHDVYEFVNEKDKIKYISLKEPNPSGHHTIAFKTDLPKQFGLEPYIDKETQFKKTFIGPVDSLACLVGWKAEKNLNSIADLFV